MKKFNTIILGSLVCANLAFAVSFDDILNKGIDKIWGKIYELTSSVADVCYEPMEIDIPIEEKVCKQIEKIDKLTSKVCSYAPKIPGFQKKSKDIGLTGLKSFCEAEVRDFVDIVATTAGNVAENVWDEKVGKVSNKTLPNGQKYSDFLKVWDINQVLKKDGDKPNIIRDYVLNRKEDELNLLMSYSKSANAKGRKISDIKLEEIKAPANLEEYKKGVFELANSLSQNQKDTAPSNVSSSLSLQLAKTSDEEKNSVSKQYVANLRPNWQNAKANEIGQALELARTSDDFSIPTQEYVNIIRADKKPQVIAQIRKQQMREAQIVAEINAKWDKREILTKLIADKEVIMSMKFNEDSAKAKIDEIVNSVQ